jgi:LL-diaminopimelate aminotransferase
MSEFTFSDRAMHFQAGIFAVLDEKKRRLQKEGRTIYNLSVGTPDFPTPPHITKAVSEAAKDPENYKYSLTDRPFLLHAVEEFYKNRFGVSLEDDEIMTISGSQEGMAHIALALCNPGDLVLVPDPGYPIFSIGPQLCSAKAVGYDLLPGTAVRNLREDHPEPAAKCTDGGTAKAGEYGVYLEGAAE